jgi:hypothetical protein
LHSSPYIRLTVQSNKDTNLARGTGGNVNRTFKNQQELDNHFSTHGAGMQRALGRNTYSPMDYLRDTNYVIRNGTFVPELHGYVRLIRGTGSAKYALVGLDRATGNITTFHIKTVSELSRTAPNLGLGY